MNIYSIEGNEEMEEQKVKELICEIKHSSIPVQSQDVLLKLVDESLVNTKSTKSTEDGRQCPKCGSYETKVLYNRYVKKQDKHIRERKCKECGEKWHTKEVVVEEL